MTATVNASYTQVSFRARFDDGSQTSATWQAAVNTNWTQNATTVFRVRFLVRQTVSSATALLAKAFKIKYSLNGGAYTDVAAQGATTAPIRYANSANITDNEATTQQIGSGTFLAGVVDENGNTGTLTFSGTQNQETEIEFVVEFYTPQFTNGDTITLRVYETGDTALATYTTTPTIRPAVVAARRDSISGTTIGGVAIGGDSFTGISYERRRIVVN